MCITNHWVTSRRQIWVSMWLCGSHGCGWQEKLLKICVKAKKEEEILNEGITRTNSNNTTIFKWVHESRMPLNMNKILQCVLCVTIFFPFYDHLLLVYNFLISFSCMYGCVCVCDVWPYMCVYMRMYLYMNGDGRWDNKAMDERGENINLTYFGWNVPYPDTDSYICYFFLPLEIYIDSCILELLVISVWHELIGDKYYVLLLLFNGHKYDFTSLSHACVYFMIIHFYLTFSL